MLYLKRSKFWFFFHLYNEAHPFAKKINKLVQKVFFSILEKIKSSCICSSNLHIQFPIKQFNYKKTNCPTIILYELNQFFPKSMPNIRYTQRHTHTYTHTILDYSRCIPRRARTNRRSLTAQLDERTNDMCSGLASAVNCTVWSKYDSRAMCMSGIRDIRLYIYIYTCGQIAVMPMVRDEVAVRCLSGWYGNFLFFLIIGGCCFVIVFLCTWFGEWWRCRG